MTEGFSIVTFEDAGKTRHYVAARHIMKVSIGKPGISVRSNVSLVLYLKGKTVETYWMENIDAAERFVQDWRKAIE